MPTQLEIRDAIKAKMLTVDHVGVVHTFERYASNLSDLAPLYISEGKILGWYIRLVNTNRQSNMNGRLQITHTWQIRGFMSLDDSAASELAFDSLVEQLQDAFAADENLGGLLSAGTVIEEDATAGLQRDDAGPVMFSGVLCHAVKLRLFTRHHQ
jgi:hypothetical protein